MSTIKITVDGEEREIEIENIEELKNLGVHIEKEIKGNTKRKKSSVIKNRITGATPLIVTLAYLSIGFIWGVWHPTWLLFLLIPIVPIVLYGIGKGKGAVVSLTTFATIAAFFILGFGWGLWHPGWLIFLLIPIVSILVGEEDDDSDFD